MESKEKLPEFFKSTKTSLKSILKRPEINTAKINDTVIKAHKIVIHTLQFLKLFLLHHYDTRNLLLPVIDSKLVNNAMKVICGDKEEKRGRPPNKDTMELKDKLTSFYNEHYKPHTQQEQLDYTYMNNILVYLSDDIITMYENNIQLHYVDYVERFVNVVWKKKMLTEKIRKLYKTKAEREARIRSLCGELRKIKKDLLNVDKSAYTSKPYYHSWITEQKKRILPVKKKFQKDSVYYDLKCKPMEYFSCMITMMKDVEREEETLSNVFPLLTGITPNYIRLDTITLVHLLLRKEQGNKGDYTDEGNTKKHEDKIWQFFFRTERKLFTKTGYSFHHMISTDGVGVSILFLRKDLVGAKLPNTRKNISKEIYIDELGDYTELQSMKIVGIDPGKEDLIYCVDGASKEANVFRSSQNQRRKETKMKKYNNIILAMKTNTIQGRTIIEYETDLSNFNRKTLDVGGFKQYVREKNRMNHILFDFYGKQLFRKLKFGRYINEKRNEINMINQFKKIFGKPEEVAICIGDWEQKEQMKYKEPTLGKGIRTLFRKNNYKVYLVDEFRSSCRCSNCNGGVCEKFRLRENPKPK